MLSIEAGIGLICSDVFH